MALLAIPELTPEEAAVLFRTLAYAGALNLDCKELAIALADRAGMTSWLPGLRAGRRFKVGTYPAKVYVNGVTAALAAAVDAAFDPE
jgi:hypothetical protein